MRPEVPQDLLDQSANWHNLAREQRARLGKRLRSLGLMQSEIRNLIPVPKSTLSYWCREVELTPEQIAEIRRRGYSQTGVPRDTQRKRREERNEIRQSAYDLAPQLYKEPLFGTGVALYWAEGSKTQPSLEIANTDPALLRVFIEWVRRYLDSNAEFRLSLHLHEGMDEPEAKRYWQRELSLPSARFTKTYIKRGGTGHRKNRLDHGVCRVRVCRSADFWHRTMAWIEHARDHGV